MVVLEIVTVSFVLNTKFTRFVLKAVDNCRENNNNANRREKSATKHGSNREKQDKAAAACSRTSDRQQTIFAMLLF